MVHVSYSSTNDPERIGSSLSDWKKPTSLSWRDQFCAGARPGAFAHTRPTLHLQLPVKASQRAGKSPERRLSASVDTNPGLRGEASPGMDWGVGVRSPRFLDSQHRVHEP
jgi:hypothetical protein